MVTVACCTSHCLSSSLHNPRARRIALSLLVWTTLERRDSSFCLLLARHANSLPLNCILRYLRTRVVLARSRCVVLAPSSVCLSERSNRMVRGHAPPASLLLSLLSGSYSTSSKRILLCSISADLLSWPCVLCFFGGGRREIDSPMTRHSSPAAPSRAQFGCSHWLRSRQRRGSSWSGEFWEAVRPVSRSPIRVPAPSDLRRTHRCLARRPSAGQDVHPRQDDHEQDKHEGRLAGPRGEDTRPDEFVVSLSRCRQDCSAR